MGVFALIYCVLYSRQVNLFVDLIQLPAVLTISLNSLKIWEQTIESVLFRTNANASKCWNRTKKYKVLKQTLPRHSKKSKKPAGIASCEARWLLSNSASSNDCKSLRARRRSEPQFLMHTLAFVFVFWSVQNWKLRFRVFDAL